MTVASTTIASSSNGVALPFSSLLSDLYVETLTGFPSDGVLLIQNSTGALQVVAYTGTGTNGGNHFTGCTGGAGFVSTGGLVLQAIFTTTTISASVQGCLPVGTINVASTTGFPTAGPFIYVQTSAGFQVVSTTNVLSNSFIGCAGGTGAMSNGGLVVLLPWTMVSDASNETNLPQTTLNVFSTTEGFPASGTIVVQSSAGPQLVTYTDVGTSSFTGCAGGAGTLSTYGAVWGLGAPVVPPLVVASYAELRLIYPAVSGIQQVYVLGANLPGDGGQGLFIWDAKVPPSYAINDNAGVVLQSAWPSASSNPGVWRRAGSALLSNSAGAALDVVPGPIGLRWFGAVGDGTTDDTAAFMSALKVLLNRATTVSAPSYGAVATINVASTSGFVPSGTLTVQTSGGLQTITYRGITPTAFTGCIGGAGVVSTGGIVIGTSSNASTLLIAGGVYRLASSITIPCNTTLAFQSAMISVDPGCVLTVGGPIEAGSVQIFTGAGSSTFGGTRAFQELNVKWWGAQGDGATDDTEAIQAALDAAAGLTQSLTTVAQLPPGAPLYTLGVTVYIPPGQYVTGVTLEQSNGVRLRGSGLVYLSPTPQMMQTLVILRCAGPFTDVEGISFSGGLTAIALGGGPLRNTKYMPAIYMDAPPMNIQRCEFLYQYGPSIWQDGGPATTIAEASNGVALSTTTIDPNVVGQSATNSTIAVVSTLGFLPSGSLVVQTSTGAQIIAYSSISLNTFTGCSGGTPATLAECASVSALVAAATTIAGNGQSASAPTLTVSSTAGFSRIGSLIVQVGTSLQVICYGGKTATTFTACTGGTAVALFNGASVIAAKAIFTTVNGNQSLPASSITVATNGTAGFPSGGGILFVANNSGIMQALAYSGVGTSSFTLSASGGTGVLNSGTAIYAACVATAKSTGWDSAIITVSSTDGFPSNVSDTNPGTLVVTPCGGGPIVVKYTALTATTFTVCSPESGSSPCLVSLAVTLNVVSPGSTITPTLGFTSGSLMIYLGGGNSALPNYTGISGNTQITGVNGGVGTLVTGNTVSLADDDRTTQYFLIVDHCHFRGPCFLWCSGDTIQVRDCLLQPDWVSLASPPASPGYPGYPVSTDGVPLGILNSNDVLVIEGCAFGPYTLLGPARRALFVGAGTLTIRSCHTTDVDNICTIRLAVLNNGWQGSAGAPMYLGGTPALLVANQPVVPTSLCIDDFSLLNSTDAYWLECHDSIPSTIDLQVQTPANFDETWGVWVDSSLNLQNLVLYQQCAPEASSDAKLIPGWRCPGNPNAYAAFQVRQGPDPTTVLTSDVTLPGTGPAIPIAVADTAAFPTSGTLTFTIAGQAVTYEGTNPTAFTNCTDGAGDFLAGSIVTTVPGRFAGAEVTSYFVPFIEFPTRSRSLVQGIAEQNLMLAGVVSLPNNLLQLGTAGGSIYPPTTDMTTGYSLEVYNYGAAGGELVYNMPFVPESGTLPAGLYCFSFYVFASADCTVATDIRYNLNHAGISGFNTLNNERVFGSDTWQRVSVPFYFPGGTCASVSMTMGSSDIAPEASLSYGLFQLNKGAVPTPYRTPGNIGPYGGVGNFVPQQYYGTASPTDANNPATGDVYKLGDIVWNTAPAVGSYIGWVCTITGTVGSGCVFSPFGPIG